MTCAWAHREYKTSLLVFRQVLTERFGVPVANDGGHEVFGRLEEVERLRRLHRLPAAKKKPPAR
jgi:hypothetical protein